MLGSDDGLYIPSIFPEKFDGSIKTKRQSKENTDGISMAIRAQKL